MMAFFYKKYIKSFTKTIEIYTFAQNLTTHNFITYS
jgi:hypothetical protein